MARTSQKDLLSRLADAGEAAIKSLGDAPGADRVLNAMNAMRDRMDELQRRVRGLEGLEQRLADLEKKVDKLAKASGMSSTPSGSRRATTARKTTATKSTGAPAARRGGKKS
jgi:TolA-binding protein